MTELVYENEHYRVVLDRTSDEPYLVVNKEYDVTEASEANQPQALILAKQFDMLLTNDRWSKQLDQMYAGPSFSLDDVESFGQAH